MIRFSEGNDRGNRDGHYLGEEVTDENNIIISKNSPPSKF